MNENNPYLTLARLPSNVTMALEVAAPTVGDVFFWQPLLASALIIAIPIGLVYNLFLDRLIQGFTVGAVKG